MPRPTDAELAAALRPVAEALVRREDVKRDQEHDRTHSAGGSLRADRVAGTLPPNTAGVIQAGSVQTPPNDLSASQNLAGQLTDTAAAVGAKLTNPMTAPGDLVIGGASGGGTRLAIGDEGDVLTVVSGAPAWAPPAAATGDLVYAEGDFVFDSAGVPVVVG